MPKYYIRDCEDRLIIDADCPIRACIKALRSGKFPTVMAGGHYWISERGWDVHPSGDLKLSSDEVNEAYLKTFYNDT